MYLCGIDGDEQPTAINLANCKSIVLVSYDDGDVFLVEWGDSELSRSVNAEDATICIAQRVGAVLMALKAARHCH